MFLFCVCTKAYFYYYRTLALHFSSFDVTNAYLGPVSQYPNFVLVVLLTCRTVACMMRQWVRTRRSSVNGHTYWWRSRCLPSYWRSHNSSTYWWVRYVFCYNDLHYFAACIAFVGITLFLIYFFPVLSEDQILASTIFSDWKSETEDHIAFILICNVCIGTNALPRYLLLSSYIDCMILDYDGLWYSNKLLGSARLPPWHAFQGRAGEIQGPVRNSKMGPTSL